MDLTEREERFVVAYAQCLNATEAAITAGYSAKTAAQAGSRLLKKVKKLIDERQQLALKQAGGVPESQRISAIASLEQSLQMATALAFYDPRKLYEGDNLKSPSQLKRRHAVMITGFDVEETFTKVGDHAEHTGYIKKVKLVDRAPYLNMLLKWHRAFAEKAPPKAPVTEEDLSNWTTEDFEAYQKLKAKLKPTILNGTTT